MIRGNKRLLVRGGGESSDDLEGIVHGLGPMKGLGVEETERSHVLARNDLGFYVYDRWTAKQSQEPELDPRGVARRTAIVVPKDDV